MNNIKNNKNEQDKRERASAQHAHEGDKANQERKRSTDSTFEPLKALLLLGVKEQIANDWLEVRKGKRAKLTQTALDGLMREAGKAGLSAQDVVQLCAERGWQSFNASWNWRDEKGSYNEGPRGDWRRVIVALRDEKGSYNQVKQWQQRQ